MALEHKLDKIKKRTWNVVRDAWMEDIPAFTVPGARPDPGLEKLPTLQAVNLPQIDDLPVRILDIEGIRRNALWEAVFLFHKCSHANLAAQRLGEQGMHSWCMFNAYHSAYLGAKGIVELLGVALPSLNGRQVLIDLFPEPSKQPKKTSTAHISVSSRFQEFQIIRLDRLDQQGLWAVFQRVLRISVIDCWNGNLYKELINIQCKKITSPRNSFLYKAHFWPLEDLMSDAALEGMQALVGTELDADGKGFLLRLCFSVYHLFEQLIGNLAEYSSVIKEQIDESRCLFPAELPELGCYKNFLAQIATVTGGGQ